MTVHHQKLITNVMSKSNTPMTRSSVFKAAFGKSHGAARMKKLVKAWKQLSHNQVIAKTPSKKFVLDC